MSAVGLSQHAAAPRRAAQLWWLHPVRLVLMGVLPIYLAVLAFDLRRQVANQYIPSALYVFGLVLILALAAGMQTALLRRPQQAPLAAPSVSSGLLLLLLLPTVGAYALWFGPLLAQPALLLEVASGQRAEVRDAISTMAGVTTFTQFGVAYMVAHALKEASPQGVTRLERAGLALVLLLATFRAFAWAERLAIIELVVSYSVARLAFARLHSPAQWRLASAAPAVAPLFLYLIFTASEYFRTWEFLSQQYDSVWEMSLERLLTYYATAVNNGIGVLSDTSNWPYYNGAFIFESLFRMPGLGPLLHQVLGSDGGIEQRWLEYHGSPAFNSPTAYFRVILDLGYFGAVVYFLCLGYLIGRAYRGFLQGQIFGLVAYGVCVLFLLESLRYSYISEGRFVPLLLGLLLLARDIHQSRKQGGTAAVAGAALPSWTREASAGR